MTEEYKCTLDDYFLKMAKEDLKEDPKNRIGAVETLRTWIKSQSHIKCPTDTPFILKYLRVAKFSQLVAREFLTNHLKFMTETPHYFYNIDMMDNKIQKFLNTGYLLLLPKRDPLGRQICIIRTGVMDVKFKTYDKQALYKACIGLFVHLLTIEENQVAGFVYFFDLTGFGLAHRNICGLEDVKLNAKMWTRCYPGRFKGVHYYNHGSVCEVLFEMFKTFLSKKLKDRLHFHGSNMEGVYKVLPKECLPEEYLPDDYTGPNAGSIQQLIGDTLHEIPELFSRDYLKKKMSQPDVVEQIKRDTDPSLFHIEPDAAKNVDIPVGSFRRLNTD